jgi:hypothetical protein
MDLKPAPKNQNQNQNPKTKDQSAIGNRQSPIGNLVHSYLSATNGSTFVARRAGM